jgi:5-methylcytosine-specific restriction endonuclease McrA
MAKHSSEEIRQATERHCQAVEAIANLNPIIVKQIKTIRNCDAIRGDLDNTNYHIYQLTHWVASIHDVIRELFQLTETQVQEIVARVAKIESIRELIDLPYREYLLTPEWQERRQRILKRDGLHCQVCNSPEHLNVHHRDYTRRGYENDSDLTTLCQSCHQVFHENSRLVRVEA